MVTFTGIQIADRREAHTRVVHWLRESQRTLDQCYASRNLAYSRALAAIAADPELLLAVRSADRLQSATSRRARTVVQQYVLLAVEMAGAEAGTIVAANGRTLAVAPLQATAAQLVGGGSGSVGIRDLSAKLYTVTATPLRWHGRVIANLLLAKRLHLAGLSSGEEAAAGTAVFRHGRLFTSQISQGWSSQIARLPTYCIQTGCELCVGNENVLAAPLSDAAIGAGPGSDDRVVVFRSVDVAVDQLSQGWRASLPALGVLVALFVLLSAGLVSHGLFRPLRGLIARLEFSQAAGRWEADFPEDSASWEVNQLAAAINRAASAVAHSNERLDQVSIEFVEAMAQALDARDPCTAGHSKRVSDYASAIATVMNLPPGEIETIRLGARLHDIGKIGISDMVLQKAGRLTPDEYDAIKLHPQIGRKILERFAAFERYLPLVELHHEDFDGHGYPYGLKGDEIPIGVRIIRVADVFDALTTDRSYRKGMPIVDALEVIHARAGQKFDPDVVLALHSTLGHVAPGRLRGLESVPELSLG